MYSMYGTLSAATVSEISHVGIDKVHLSIYPFIYV